MLGKKHTKETKRKMSNARLERKKKFGYINSPETRKKISLARKGKSGNNKGKHWKISEEGLKNHKGFKKGKIPYEMTEKIKEKMSKVRKGIKLSDETKRKMSVSHKKGMTEEVLERMREAQIRRWDRVGRKPYKRYKHIGSLAIYRKWRMAVFTRDNFTCQFCGIRGCYLEAHHIKSWTDFPKLRYEVDNGVTLCKECHKLI